MDTGPKPLPIVLYQLNTFRLRATFTNTDDGTPFDLTDYTVYASLGSYGEEALLDFTPSFEDDDPTLGIVVISIDVPDTLEPGDYNWDMNMKDSDDIKTPLIIGTARVEPFITDAS